MMTMMQVKTPPLTRLPLPSHVDLPPTGILYLVLASLVLRPIKRIGEQADDISRGKIEGEDIIVKGNDEIAGLANSFNRMTRSLIKMMKLLEQPPP